jgi:hypothetical protein
MENPSDKKIKKDLKLHLEKTAADIKKHDGWNMINLSELSQNELMEVACKHGNLLRFKIFEFVVATVD